MQQLSLHVGVGGGGRSAFEDGGHGHTLGGGVGGCMFCHSSVQQTWSVQSWLSIHTVQRFSMSLQMVNKDVLLPKSCRNLFVYLTPDPSDGKVGPSFVVRKAFLELHSKAAWRRSQDENKHTNKQTNVCVWMNDDISKALRLLLCFWCVQMLLQPVCRCEWVSMKSSCSNPKWWCSWPYSTLFYQWRNLFTVSQAECSEPHGPGRVCLAGKR